METLDRIKLSSDLILTKSLCFLGVCISFLSAFGTSKNPVDSDFKTALEWKIFFIVTTGFLIYFLTRPGIYFDQANLYIKKVRQKEIVIPLKNIKSLFENPLSVSKGTARFTIEFINNSNEPDSIKFTGNYSSSRLKEFKILIKKENPKVEII